MRNLLFLILTFTSTAFTQVHLGIKAGIPITDMMHTSGATGAGQGIVSDIYSSNTKRLLIGPTVNVTLPLGFRLEFDALYQRANYEHTFLTTHIYTSETFSHNTANRWQFPLLLQYRLPLPVVKPFVEAGPSFSRISGGHNVTVKQDNIFGSFQGITSQSSKLVEVRHSTVAGFTTGVGFDLHVLVIHVAPEVRFTRWGSSQFEAVSEFAAIDIDQPLPLKVPSISSNLNQVDFLLGITF